MVIDTDRSPLSAAVYYRRRRVEEKVKSMGQNIFESDNAIYAKSFIL